MSVITMTSKGQITLPAATRAKLRLAAGVKMDVRETADGEIVLRPKRGDLRKLRGIVKYAGPTISIDEMDEAVRDAAVKSHLRSIK